LFKANRTGGLQAPKFEGPGGHDLRIWERLEERTIQTAMSNVEFDLTQDGWDHFPTIKIEYQKVQFTSVVNIVWFAKAATYGTSYRNQVVRTTDGGATMTDNWNAARSSCEGCTAMSNTSDAYLGGNIIIYNWQSATVDKTYLQELYFPQTASNYSGGGYSFSGSNPGTLTAMKMEPSAGNIDNGQFTVWGSRYG